MNDDRDFRAKDNIVIVKHSRTWSGDRCSQLLSELGYEIDWCYPQEGMPLPDTENFRAAIILGCRNSVNDDEEWIHRELAWVESCLKNNCAFMGICFGGQLLAKVLGASVTRHEADLTEVGFIDLYPAECAGCEFDIPRKLFQWHKEGFELPADTTLLCRSERYPNQAFRYNDNAYGLQFHPEVNHSVITQWFSTNEDYEAEGLDPDSRARHLDYARKHDDSITEWFEGFLRDWLNSQEF